MREYSDSEKLERLYELYEQKMYAVAFSILRNEWQAEDAVQDALYGCLRIYESFGIWKMKKHGPMFFRRFKVLPSISTGKIK